MQFIIPLAISLVAAIPTVSAYPIDADVVNCRSGPGTSFGVVKTYKKGDDVKLTCQAPGTSVNGDTLWDKTSDGCYVADYYVKTGTPNYVTAHCDSGSPAPSPAPAPSTGGTGSAIVAAAEKEKGLPYIWGGGGCSGPSGGGFDCSGLTQYSICQALKKTIPRTAQTQYHSDMGKHIPRAQAQEGDLIFWADGGDCANKVSHVGIFIKDGLMINAAHSGTPVREQSIWTSSGGESICPDAVRFS